MTDDEHILCKLRICVGLVHASRALSDRPIAYKLHCWPLLLSAAWIDEVNADFFAETNAAFLSASASVALVEKALEETNDPPAGNDARTRGQKRKLTKKVFQIRPPDLILTAFEIDMWKALEKAI
jgi:hypothetical protein